MKRSAPLRSRPPRARAAAEARRASRAEVRAAWDALYRGTPLEVLPPPAVEPPVRVAPVELRQVNAGPRDLVEPIEKGPQLRSERYLAAVREMPCCFCNAASPGHAHHVLRRSRRNTVNDITAIALCPACHHDVHAGRIASADERAAVYETQARLFEQRGALWWLGVMREIAGNLEK